MGLGETQVFQDEKSRLANTTVARIVAAKGSLTDPDVKKECCRKLQKLNAIVGLGTSDKVVCRVLGGSDKCDALAIAAAYKRKYGTVLKDGIRKECSGNYGGQFVVPLPAAPPPRGPFYPYMAPGHGG